ncbi:MULTISPECIES: hypothetical protein [unclassified Rhizobium]|uniref:hypothetical protein n=1 Tax=unclassified Rhizobium TaxID=2613769 RepID=UPI001469DD1E|nr:MULTISPECIES: hypothetical protein [unclassified Rhizobium]MBD9445784.1 hypothetical protein [Rhizobium sp. RHZ01]NMN73885.1 hypothetical protein [Rhizobium sp. 57MFTsu3.2]
MHTIRTVRPVAMSLPEPGSLYLRLTRMPVKDQRIAEFALLLAIAIVLPVVAIMQVPA